MTNKLLFAMGVRRGLAHMHPHLKHFYETTAHAKRSSAHMLASGLHRSFHSHKHHHKMIGHGAKKRDDSSDEEEGKGLKHHSNRRPKPLMFKF